MAKICWTFIMATVGTVIGFATAVTEEEKTAVRTAALPVLAACGAEVGVSKEEVLAAKKSKDPDALSPCFYACFFKKGNIIDDKGLFDVDAANKAQKKYFHDEEDLKKLEEVTKICSSINDKEVSDGAKGCERAKLLVHCMHENKGIVRFMILKWMIDDIRMKLYDKRRVKNKNMSDNDKHTSNSVLNYA